MLTPSRPLRIESRCVKRGALLRAPRALQTSDKSFCSKERRKPSPFAKALVRGSSNISKQPRVKKGRRCSSYTRLRAYSQKYSDQCRRPRFLRRGENPTPAALMMIPKPWNCCVSAHNLRFCVVDRKQRNYRQSRRQATRYLSLR